MFADIDASSIVSLIGKPVWVFTETRKFNRNGRIYTASNVRNAIYKGSIQTIQIETVPVSQGPSKGWLPACFANVAVSIPDENGVSKYSLYLERQLLNVTVFETEEEAKREMNTFASLNSTYTATEIQLRDLKKNLSMFKRLEEKASVWNPTTDFGSSFPQSDYEALLIDCEKIMETKDAFKWISSSSHIPEEKITILFDTECFEKNCFGTYRVKSREIRFPLYDSPTRNYVHFGVDDNGRMVHKEIINGEIKPYNT